MIIWITGLPGSGKTTLAKKIKSILEPKISNNIVILDGDNIREILPFNIYYSNEHGINSRLSEVQSAILNVKLKYVDKNIVLRKKIAKICVSDTCTNSSTYVYIHTSSVFS